MQDDTKKIYELEESQIEKLSMSDLTDYVNALYLFAKAFCTPDNNLQVYFDLNRIKKFFKSLKTEFKKIVWPNRSQLVKQTIAVLLISLLLGAFIWLIDFGAKSLIGVTSQVGTGTTTAPTESAK